MRLIPAIMIISLLRLSKKPDFLRDPLTWFLITFCVIMFLYFLINFRLMSSMEQKDGSVKANLERQVKLLNKGVRWRLLIMRGAVLLFFAVHELLVGLHYHSYTTDGPLYPLATRLLIYCAFFIGFFLLTHFAIRFRYKKQIKRMEELLEQTK
jgi:hypothetical protein